MFGKHQQLAHILHLHTHGVRCRTRAANDPLDFTITVEGPSWLKASTNAFTFKTLCLTGFNPR